MSKELEAALWLVYEMVVSLGFDSEMTGELFDDNSIPIEHFINLSNAFDVIKSYKQGEVISHESA